MKKLMFNIFVRYFSLILIFIFAFSTSYATYTVSSGMQKLFNNFVVKLDAKLTDKKQIIFLENLNEKIVFLSETRKLSSKQSKIFKDLLVLSNERIFFLNDKELLEQKSQKFVESGIIGDLRKSLNKISTPSFVKGFETNHGLQIIKISNNQEYIEGSTIKRAVFSKYYEVTSQNYRSFLGKKGFILLNLNGTVWYVNTLNSVEKIPYSDAYKYSKGFITDRKRYVYEGGNYYSYNFKNFVYLEDKYGFYKSDLERNGIILKDSVLLLGANKRYNFITSPVKTKLISSDIIYGITDKQRFLEHLVNDKLHLSGDTDTLFIQLEKEILKLVDGLSREEKIKKIYAWILENVSYTENLDINDKKIFSGILTYKSKDGVCEGYVKLNSYALMFAGVSGSDVIRGDVIDAQDFPKIGHAWLKVDDKYYDPTFDDPIGSKIAKREDEYKFFDLPRDLLYVNRFDYGVTPEILKTKSMDFRVSFINQRLSKLSDKYRGENYLVLKGVDFRKSNGLKVGESISLEDATKVLPYHEVTEKSSGEIYFYKNGAKKNISKLQYFIVDNNNINQVFEQRNFEIDGLYLFKWNFANGKSEYRIGFDVEIR